MSCARLSPFFSMPNSTSQATCSQGIQSRVGSMVTPHFGLATYEVSVGVEGSSQNPCCCAALGPRGWALSLFLCRWIQGGEGKGRGGRQTAAVLTPWAPEPHERRACRQTPLWITGVLRAHTSHGSELRLTRQSALSLLDMCSQSVGGCTP